MKVKLKNNAEIDIYVEVIGEGLPILFLHGGPGCCHESFAPFFKPLSSSHQVIYYDQIGCGNSNWDIDFKYEINHEIEVIEAIREKLGYDALTVVGESWGTYLGLQYASLHPNRVNSLILLSSVGYSYAQIELFGELLHKKMTDEDKKKIKEIEGYESNGIINSQQANSRSQNIYNKYYLYDIDNYSKIIEQPINSEQHYRVINLFNNELDFIERTNVLESVDIYMFQAENDIITPDNIESILLPYIKPNSFTRVSKCGHWIYLEQTDYIISEIKKIVI
ncbi:alpha/beta hydrolase [Aliivibrio fischeri]|uniref:alpha/beta hydrolase n=1 Tax=Aliivibrio fischeri TaxID=668 RepID=UPI0012DA46E1|nr:alpha/beta hydrolase [Aliivibrio fischeri]MUK66855.1 alpha/beta fold hydrolase [Aliivibrio fischeri]